MDIKELQKILNVSFSNKKLLICSVTHKSYLKDNNLEKLESYERLEFLGDAILSFIISDYFYRKYPLANEGDLSRFRSRVVQRTTLEFISRKLKISPYILISENLKKDPHFRLPLDDVYEAIIGAIYLDKGISTSKRFIYSTLICELDNVPFIVDYKSQLQEEIQKLKHTNCISYEVVKEEGPDNHKKFYVDLKIDGKVFVSSKAYSKKIAESKAAKKALERIKDGKK